MAKRVDRISELHVHFIHQILCCTKLNVKDVARSCILSKRWYYCWSSIPNLIFRQLQNYSTDYTYMNLEKYVKLVDQSLRSNDKQNLHLEQFILTYHDPKLDSHLDTWIELAVKLNVTELGIHHSFSSSYNLPDVIYDARKLTTLRLTRCKFEFDISTTHIRFYCLEVLYLHHVLISDAQLQRIIDRSLFIRILSLVVCRRINKFQVYGPVHVENLIVELCKLGSLIVQAPNLEYFKYVGYIDHPCEIAILDGYNTLKTLELSGITDQQFRDVSCKFPNISELNLTRCFKLRNIEIQSEKLKKLTLSKLNSMEKVTIQAPNLLNLILSRGTNLEKVMIQAPKLLEFNFSGDTMPFSSMDPFSLERARLKFFSTSTVISNFGDVESS